MYSPPLYICAILVGKHLQVKKNRNVCIIHDSNLNTYVINIYALSNTFSV